MRADQLKEAQQAVDGIRAIDLQLAYGTSTKAAQIEVSTGRGSTANVYLNHDITRVALEMQKDAWRKRRAELVRRLNQLGVIL